MNLFQYPVPNSIFVSTSSAVAGCSSPGCRLQEAVWKVEAVPLSVDDDDDDNEEDDSCIVIDFCFFRCFSRFSMMAFAITVPSIMELAR